MKQLSASIIALLAILASQGLMGAKERVREDDRLDLAAAYALEGMLLDARSILDSAPAEWRKVPGRSTSRKTPEQARVECRALQWALLNRLLQASSEDPFDLLVTILEKHSWGGDENDPIDSLMWRKLFTRYADRESYRPISDYVRQSTRAYLTVQLARDEFDDDLARQAATAQLGEVEHEIAGSVEGRDAGVNSAAEDPLHPLLMGLLLAQRRTPFREVLLAPRFQPVDLPADEEDARAAKVLAGFSFPKGFEPVRAEVKGNEAVALGLSQDYDPVGEISRGAYWVLRSHDGGKTWGAPLYTGLRIQQPYVVRPISNAPMLAEDQLQVEVRIEELDETSITFPPIGLRAKREKGGLLLEIPFSELERDSDGDGLTDLAEERLVLDPSNPDTDGDGVGDGWDQLPQVPWSSDADAQAEALAAVLGYLFGGKSPAIIHEIAGSNSKLDDLMSHAKKAALTDERTSFIVARRMSFQALLPSQRTIVLTEEELDQARRKFGALYPIEMSLFVLDRAQRTGYVIWSASWRGGVLSLERVRDGGWQIVPRSEWIT
jgi:hypothetical protein